MALSKLVIELALIDGASRVARNAARELRTMGKTGEQAFKLMDGAAKDFANGLKGMSIARELKQSLIDPGKAAASSLQEELARFEVGLDPVSMEKMSAQLAEAKRDAARVAGPTAFSQKEVVGMKTGLMRAGLSSDDVTGKGSATEAAAQLATAEQMSADQAVNAMVTIGSVFRLEGEQFAKSADLLARAGGAAKTTAGELAEALSQASVAGTMGLSQEETFATLGMLANIGKGGAEGGTVFKAFLGKAAESDKKYGLGLYDDQGEFLGMKNAAVQLRGHMAGRSQQEQQIATKTLFGDEGSTLARALLNTGKGSLEEVFAKMENSRSLEDRVGIISGTHAAKTAAMEGSAESTMATLFEPVLQPFTAAADLANELIGRVGVAAENDPRIAKGVSYGSMGLAAAAGLGGAALMLRGAGRGVKGMGLLRGLGGTAAGIAQGKAVEEATGVQPVFVTNWPAGFGAGGPAAGLAQAAGGFNGKAALGMLGKGGLVAGVGAAAYAGGSWVQENWIKGNANAETMVQGYLASVLLQTPARLLMSDDMVDESKRARGAATDLVLDALSVTVNIDKNGDAEVVAKTGTSEKAAKTMNRSGTP